MDNNRKLTDDNIQNVIKSVEFQLNLFKERESFSVNQLLQLEERFGAFREEKERTITLLKEELEDIKGHNLLLSKLKNPEKAS